MSEDTLQERIERILAEHPILPPTYAGDDPIARKRKRTAARISEEIAAEVRSAQHEAWDEGLEAGRDRWADSREFGDPPVNPYPIDIEQED